MSFDSACGKTLAESLNIYVCCVGVPFHRHVDPLLHLVLFLCIGIHPDLVLMICVKDGGVNVIIIYSNNIIIFLAFYPRLVAKVEVKPQAPVADLERCEVLDPPRPPPCRGSGRGRK